MNSLLEAGDKSLHSVRAAVIAAAFAVTACFGAAATFTAAPVQAADTQETR